MTKITVIGAGSASFGKNTLSAIMPDPVITDMETAKQILDDYPTTYKEHLPQFWK